MCISPFRVKAVRVWEIGGIEVDAPQVGDDRAAFRDDHAIVHEILRARVGRPAEDRDWPPPQRLVHNGVDEWEVFGILERRHAVRADDGVELLLRLGNEGRPEGGTCK